MDEARKDRRGFGSMTPEKQREIASKGGRAAHEKGTAHEWKKGEEATREAGRKGGAASQKKRREQRNGGGSVTDTATEAVGSGEDDLTLPAVVPA